MQRRRSISLSLLALLCAASARAQQNECLQRVVPIHVAMRDDGLPPKLDPSSFAATFADKAVRVVAVSEEQRPQRVMVLLDASGSIRGGTTAGWEATVEVAAQLLVNLPPLEVGLALFSEEVEPMVRPTLDRDRLREEIERLRAGPRDARGRRQRTALWDSLFDSVSMFGPFRIGDVLYVITDGVDNHSETRPAAVTEALAAGGIRLFAFAIANEGFAYGSGELERMVDDTGGSDVAGSARDWRAFQAAQQSPIGGALAAQYRQIASFHRLDLQLTENMVRPETWNLALRGLSENEKQNLMLSYPLRLFPCN